MKIVAIGGYKSEDKKRREFDTPLCIDQRIVSLSGKTKPKVLFVPTASSDSDGYISMFRKVYESQLNCEVDVLKMAHAELTRKEMNEKVTWADIIYVGGGNTLKMMKRWRRLGMDELLKKAALKGVVLCGVSAGSICWFEYGISDSLQFYKPKSNEFIKVKGLGLLPFINNPHFGSAEFDKGLRTMGMKTIMLRTKGVCLAIPDGCAIEFNEENYQVISGTNEAKAYKAYSLQGTYHLDTIPQAGKISSLLP
jgi:dipeptidase E